MKDQDEQCDCCREGLGEMFRYIGIGVGWFFAFAGIGLAVSLSDCQVKIKQDAPVKIEAEKP